ncbi:MAG: SRPBCC domain-containing protein [Pseudomonadota bacterium]
MATRTRGYALRADISAPTSRVWTALTEPVLLARWLGVDPRIQPRQGGHFSVTLAPGLARQATIDIFDPPRRLRLIYLPPPSLPALDAAVVDDFLIGWEDESTVVRVLCSGVPDNDAWTAHFSQTRGTMERAMARLRVLVEQQGRIASMDGKS